MVANESPTLTRFNPLPEASPGPSVTELVSGIVGDAQTLLRQQTDMLKAEVREDFRRSKRAAEYGAVGIVFCTAGVLCLVTGLVYLFHEYYGYTLWASWGIVGGIIAIIGGCSAAYSYYLLERFNPLPDKTFNALKENITWQTK